MKSTSLKKGFSVFLMALGVWTMFSSWWMNLSGAALWNSFIIGGVLFVLGAVREWGDMTKTVWASWLSAAIGIWLFMSPYIFSFRDDAKSSVNIILVGILTVIVAGWSSVEPPEETTIRPIR